MPTINIIWNIRAMSFSHRWASVSHACTLYLKKEGIKYVFYQDIFRLPDMKVTVKATVESVCVVNGRLGDSALFDETFAPYLSE